MLLTPKDGDNESIQALLLGDIYEIFVSINTDRIRSIDLVTKLAEIEIHPWAEWGKHRRPITVVQLARALAPFAVQPKNLRLGMEVVKGYELTQFADEADDARLRAMVSETPIAEREHREAEKHASAMRRHREEVVAGIERLEQTQDDLLDRLSAAG